MAEVPHGEDVNEVREGDGITALHDAAKNGHQEVANEIVRLISLRRNR